MLATRTDYVATKTSRVATPPVQAPTPTVAGELAAPPPPPPYAAPPAAAPPAAATRPVAAAAEDASSEPVLWVGDSTFARLATCEAWTALHIRSEPLAVNGERPLELMKRLDRIADKHPRSQWRGRSTPSVTTAPHAPAWCLRGRRPPRVIPEQLGRSPRPQEPARRTA